MGRFGYITSRVSWIQGCRLQYLATVFYLFCFLCVWTVGFINSQTCAQKDTHNPRAHNTHYITTSSFLTVKHKHTCSNTDSVICNSAQCPSRGSVQPRASNSDTHTRARALYRTRHLGGGRGVGRESALPLKEWTKSLLWFRIKKKKKNLQPDKQGRGGK